MEVPTPPPSSPLADLPPLLPGHQSLGQQSPSYVSLAQQLRVFSALSPAEQLHLLAVLQQNYTARNLEAFSHLGDTQLAQQAAAQLEQQPPGPLAQPLLETLTYRLWLSLYQAGWVHSSPEIRPLSQVAAYSGEESAKEEARRRSFWRYAPLAFAAFCILWKLISIAGRPHLLYREEHRHFWERQPDTMVWSSGAGESIGHALLVLVFVGGGLLWYWRRHLPLPSGQSLFGQFLSGPSVQARLGGVVTGLVSMTASQATPAIPAVALQVRQELEKQVVLAQQSGDAHWQYEARLALDDLLPKTLSLHQERGAPDDDPAFLNALADILTIARRDNSQAGARAWAEHVAFLQAKVKAHQTE